MRARRVLMRIAGSAYIFVAVVNFVGLMFADARQQVMDLGAVIFGYTIFSSLTWAVMGTGMVLLRKWSAYVVAVGMVIGLAMRLSGLAELPGEFAAIESGANRYAQFIGPVLFIALYYYAWPALKPPTVDDSTSGPD